MVPAPPCGRPEPTLPKVMNCVSVQLGRVCSSGRELSAPGACRHPCVQKPRVSPIALPDCTGEGPRAEKAHEGIGACPIGRIFKVIQFTSPLALCRGEMEAQRSRGSRVTDKPETDVGEHIKAGFQFRAPRRCCICLFHGIFSLTLFAYPGAVREERAGASLWWWSLEL